MRRALSLSMALGFWVYSYYQAKDIFNQNFIKTFESDIRHCERYLMERFICGSVWLQGSFNQKNGYIEVKQDYIFGPIFLKTKK